MKRWLMLVMAFLLIFSAGAAKKEKKTSAKEKEKAKAKAKQMQKAEKKRPNLYAVPQGWFSSISASQSKAKRDNLPMLVVISGPEWNAESQLLEKNVIRNKDFQKSVLRKVVPIYINIPNKNLTPQQLAELKKCPAYKGKLPCVALMTPNLKLLSTPKNLTLPGFSQAISDAVGKMPKK